MNGGCMVAFMNCGCVVFSMVYAHFDRFEYALMDTKCCEIILTMRGCNELFNTEYISMARVIAMHSTNVSSIHPQAIHLWWWDYICWKIKTYPFAIFFRVSVHCCEFNYDAYPITTISFNQRFNHYIFIHNVENREWISFLGNFIMSSAIYKCRIRFNTQYYTIELFGYSLVFKYSGVDIISKITLMTSKYACTWLVIEYKMIC